MPGGGLGGGGGIGRKTGWVGISAHPLIIRITAALAAAIRTLRLMPQYRSSPVSSPNVNRQILLRGFLTPFL
jgi:hypothetical protein